MKEIMNTNPPSTVEQLLDECEDLIGVYPFLYVEVARTRITDWMVHIHTSPNKEHEKFKILVTAQNTSYEAACASALYKLKELEHEL